MPDHAPRGRLEREHLRARGDQVHHAVDDDGRSLQVLRVVAGLKDPRRRDALDVGRVDLIERAIAPGELRAAVVRPIRAGRSRVLRIQTRAGQEEKQRSHGVHNRTKTERCEVGRTPEPRQGLR